LKSRRTTRQIGFEIKEKKGHRDGYTVALILSHWEGHGCVGGRFD
jgi:hypothetical protein